MKKSLIFILMPVILSFCGTSSHISGSWHDPEAEDIHFSNLAIVAIASHLDVRKATEEAFEQQLLKKGVNAVAGLEFLPPHATKKDLTKEILTEFLALNKMDGIITISLLDKEDDRRHVPGRYYYVPTDDVPLTDYYGQMANYIYAPGYTYGSESFFLECNLYSFPAGKLLWSVQTKTRQLGSMEDAIQDFAKTAVRDLLQSDVVARP